MDRVERVINNGIKNNGYDILRDENGLYCIVADSLIMSMPEEVAAIKEGLECGVGEEFYRLLKNHRTTVAENKLVKMLYNRGMEYSTAAYVVRKFANGTGITLDKSNSYAKVLMAICAATVIIGTIMGLSEINSKSEGEIEAYEQAVTKESTYVVDLDSYTQPANVDTVDTASDTYNGEYAQTEAVNSIPVVNVPDQADYYMAVESIYATDTYTMPAGTSADYYGHIFNGSKDEYYFTAPVDGRYGFDISNIYSGAKIYMKVTDSLNYQHISTYTTHKYADLKAGETYVINLDYYNMETDYKLSVGIPRQVADISYVTAVADSVSYEDQCNAYRFTCTNSGIHYFYLSQTEANTKFLMSLKDNLGYSLINTYSGGKAAELKAGETYYLYIEQYNSLGNYTLNVCHPKNSRDITGYTTIDDSIQYVDQCNTYTFRPAVSGYYGFELNQVNADTKFVMYMYDSYNNKLLSTHNNRKSVYLEANMEYRFVVEYYNGFSGYRLLVGYPKETLGIVEEAIIYDKLTFEDQVNTYLFTASTAKIAEVNMTVYDKNTNLRIRVLDAYGNNIYRGNNSEGKFECEAGALYTVEVVQNSGLTGYEIKIK